MSDSDPVNITRGTARNLREDRKILARLARNERGRGRKWPIPEDGIGLSGGTERAVFTIDSYDADTGVAVCNVEYRPYGVAAVSGEVDGKIHVEDPKGCLFNEEEYDLVGRWGDADYMQQNGDTYGEGVWVVSGLCCLEEA